MIAHQIWQYFGLSTRQTTYRYHKRGTRDGLCLTIFEHAIRNYKSWADKHWLKSRETPNTARTDILRPATSAVRAIHRNELTVSKSKALPTNDWNSSKSSLLLSRLLARSTREAIFCVLMSVSGSGLTVVKRIRRVCAAVQFAAFRSTIVFSSVFFDTNGKGCDDGKKTGKHDRARRCAKRREPFFSDNGYQQQCYHGVLPWCAHRQRTRGAVLRCRRRRPRQNRTTRINRIGNNNNY